MVAISEPRNPDGVRLILLRADHNFIQISVDDLRTVIHEDAAVAWDRDIAESVRATAPRIWPPMFHPDGVEWCTWSVYIHPEGEKADYWFVWDRRFCTFVRESFDAEVTPRGDPMSEYLESGH